MGSISTIIKGKDGKDGIDGINGVDGKDGINGVDGVNGIDGKDGVDGINGVDGTNGTNVSFGESLPVDSDGVDGDVYIKTADGAITFYKKENGTWS